MNKGEIVISGISGRWPASDNLDELWVNLNKPEPLYEKDCFPYTKVFPAVTKTRGALKDPTLFDAKFFGYSETDASDLDAQFRVLHEAVYESLWDAGIKPEDWRSTRTGFYVGSFYDDVDTVVNPDKRTDFLQLSVTRIPYAFNFTGPAVRIDTACASSLTALHEAVVGLKSGQCDQAIVAGLAIHQRLGIVPLASELDVLSKSGLSKPLDVAADGYVRSEAIVSVVLQWSNKAKRVYSTVLGTATNSDGYKVTGITSPGPETQTVAMKKALSVASVNPLDVDYIEGHFTSTQAGDLAETTSILNAYRENSDKPVNLGLVKGHLGHSEAASGLTGLAKVIKIFQNKLIPPNIGLTNPNPKIDGLRDGRLIPIKNETKFNGKYIGINSFGFGGANSTLLVTCKAPEYNANLSTNKGAYRLVCFCNRTIEGVDKMINWIQSEPKAVRDDCLSLLDHISTTAVSTGMVARGYVILNKQAKIIKLDKTIAKQSNEAAKLTVLLDPSLTNYLEVLTHLKPFKESINSSLKCHNGQPKLPADLLTMITYIGIIDLLKSLNLSFKLISNNSFYHRTVNDYLEGKLSRKEAINLTLKETQLNGKLKQLGKPFNDISSKIEKTTSSLTLHLGSRLIVSHDGRKLLNLLDGNDSTAWLESFTSILGILYIHGFQIRLSSLYLAYNYPVSRDCPSLGGLIKWSHSTRYPVMERYLHYGESPKRTIHRVDLLDPEFFAVGDHIIDGRVIFPATGYIHLIRKHLTSTHYGLVDPFSISFRVWKVNIFRAAFITDPVQFTVIYDTGTNAFEILSSGSIYVTGFACLLPPISSSSDQTNKKNANLDYRYNETNETDDLQLTGEQFYQELAIRGYGYGSGYQNVASATIARSSAVLNATKDWMALADCFLQLEAFWSSERRLYVPTKIGELRFDADLFKSMVDSGQEFVKVYSTKPSCVGTCGMVIEDIEVKEFPIKGQKDRLRIGQQVFTPFVNSAFDLDTQLVKLRSKYCQLNLKLLELEKEDIETKEVQDFSEILSQDYNSSLLKLFQQSLDKPDKVGYIVSALKSNSSAELQDDLISMVPIECVHPLVDLVADNCRKESNISVQNFNLTSEMLKKLIQPRFSAVCKSCVFVNETIGKSKATSTKESTGNSNKSGSEMTLSVYKHKSLDLLAGANHYSVDYDESSILSTMRGNFCLILLRETVTDLEDKIANISQLKIELNTSLTPELCKLMEQSNYIQIGSTYSQDIGLRCILFRRKPSNLTKPHRIIKINGSSECSWFDEVKKSINHINDISRLWLVADDSYHNGIVGLVNCLALEPAFANKIRCIFTPGESFNSNKDLTDQLIDRDLLQNIYLDGIWGFYRIDEVIFTHKQQSSSSPFVYLHPSNKKVQWLQDDQLITELKSNPSAVNDLITVAYSALNFRDVMIANDLMPANAYPNKNIFRLGVEFSGYSATGQRLMGVSGGKSFSTFISIADDPMLLTIPVPDSWSMAQAATVPICYGTVIYALIIRGNLQPGETVLIHAGSGGVGIAAISICLSLGCKIFTTVSTVEKKRVVQRLFPQLGDECFSDSRSTAFEEDILRATHGRGVDIVLNSLIHEKLDAGLRLLTENGRFLDISKVDIYEDRQIDLNVFEPLFFPDQISLKPNVSIQVVCLATFLCSNRTNEIERLVRLLEDGIKDGSIVPLPYTVYHHSQVSDAFANMILSKHVGKLIVQMRDDSTTPCVNQTTKITEITNNCLITPSPNNAIPCIKLTIFDSAKSYIIIGGLGGMGLELIYWMVERGARRLVITSRSGIKTNYQRFAMKRIRAIENTKVEISRLDAAHFKSAIRLIREASKLGPVGGVFNLAVVLRDGLFPNQSVENFRTVCSPKIEATKNLDSLSRQNCQHLDYFVTFSSVASLGNLGQSNYGYANSYMERICENRRKDGLPGLAVQWGPVGDVGIAARTMGDKSTVAGFEPQRIQSCLEVFDTFLRAPVSVAFSAIPILENVDNDPQDALIRVSRILGVKDVRVINLKLRLRDLGMDSVQAIEVQEYLEHTYNLSLGAASIYDLTLENLVKIASVEVKSIDMEIKGLDKIFRPLKANGPRPVFFFPPAIFDFLGMLPLARGLDRQVFGIDFTDDEEIVKDWETLTDYYCSKVLTQWPSEPTYDFVSYSLGATFAFEVARKIQIRRGENSVRRIVFIDSTPFGIQQALSWSAKIASKVGGINVDKEALFAFLKRMDRKQGDGWRARAYKTTQQASKFDIMSDIIFSKYQYITEMKLEPKLKADALFFKCKQAVTSFEGTITFGLDKTIDGHIETVMVDSNHAEIINQCKDLMISKCNQFLGV